LFDYYLVVVLKDIVVGCGGVDVVEVVDF